METAASAHAQKRMAQRGIREDHIDLALQYGRELYVTGAIIYFLGRQDMPTWMSGKEADKLNGLTVIVGQQGRVITAYRNPDILRRLRRRSKHAWENSSFGLPGGPALGPQHTTEFLSLPGMQPDTAGHDLPDAA